MIFLFSPWRHFLFQFKTSPHFWLPTESGYFYCRKYDVKGTSEVRLPCGSEWNIEHSKASMNCRFWVFVNKHLNRSRPSQSWVIRLQTNPQKIQRQVNARRNFRQRTSKMINYHPIFSHRGSKKSWIGTLPSWTTLVMGLVYMNFVPIWLGRPRNVTHVTKFLTNILRIC